MTTLLVCLLILYNVWLVTYLLWEKQGKKPSEKENPPREKKSASDADIVGKSLFKMEPKEPAGIIPTPQATTKEETIPEPEKPSTFAPETEREAATGRIPDDKLDEAFRHEQAPDVFLEYEDKEEEEEPEEDLPLAVQNKPRATGASFEEIGEAVVTANNPAATDDERRHAGGVFSEMEGNELFNRLVESSASVSEKIMGLMDYYFSKPISRDGEKGEMVVQPQKIFSVPDSIDAFDIRDFV